MNLLLAIMICLQEDTAEETYRRVEETLAKAKTLSIQYRAELAFGPQKMTLKGSVFLKEGNRLKITLTSVDPAAPKQEASAASDGTTVRSLPPRPGSPEVEWNAPATLNEDVTVSLLRAGCFELHRVPSRIHFSELKPKEALIVADLRKGEDDGGFRTLTFTFKEGNGSGNVKLWIDPKTWTLKRRVLNVELVPGQNSTVTENYDTFKVNGEIPNDAFALPGK
jgi:outer membrane lipoprotein-sorting protein